MEWRGSRIVGIFLNKQPYIVRYIDGKEAGLASGMQECSLELNFISPICWVNPAYADTFQPLYNPDANEAQKHVLKQLGLLEKTYKEQILPRLLLDYDRKRLKAGDHVEKGDMVLMRTGEIKTKYEKAILAEVIGDKIY